MLYRLKIISVALSATALLMMSQTAHAQPGELSSADETFIALQEAAAGNKADKAAKLADQLSNYAIPAYVDYYRLKPRLWKAGPSEVDAFLVRHAGSAIADRMRNDWLLELGRRRDWENFDRHYPLFVLKDDLQVKCYALLSSALKGRDVAKEARETLRQPNKYGDACQALIKQLASSKQFDADDVWAQIRLAGEYGAGAVAENLAPLVGASEKQVARSVDLPLMTLARGARTGRAAHETYAIALGRLAKKDHEKAAAYVLKHMSKKLSAEEEALAWAQIALPASIALVPEAMDYWRKAGKAPLSAEGHEWKVRTALRFGDWKMVKAGILAMPPWLQRESAWVYWLGRAYAAEGDTDAAHQQYQRISGEFHFYGQLALEELGHKIALPQQASPPTPEEMLPMETNAGLARGLKFFALGMRTEGMREWSWELQKMKDRELLAAAEFARTHQLLDRMINASLRTRREYDFTQRYPTPYRDAIRNAAQQSSVDTAWVYGIIRQESRFVVVARSGVGAKGLMQLMPGTAKFVAKKINMKDYREDKINEPMTNIALGINYMRMVLNDLEGSQVLASAAYNAGPRRSRAWRAALTQPVEGAIFAEIIPFSETRGYVKHVMANASYYAALMENRSQSLKARLGTITPKSNGGTSLP